MCCYATFSISFFKKSSLHVIEDPLQTLRQPYLTLQPLETFRIGWFGGINNVHFVVDNLNCLMRSICKPPAVEFSVLTSSRGLNMISDKFNQINSSLSTPIPWSLRLVEWKEHQHPKLLETFLGSLHLVWIPSDPLNSIKQAVSHNRLVDSIQSGCLVVANSMPSYLELSSLSLLSPTMRQP